MPLNLTDSFSVTQTLGRLMISSLLLTLPLLLFTQVACAQEGSDAHYNEDVGWTVDAEIDTVRTEAGADFVVERVEGIDPRYESIIRQLVAEGEWKESFVRDLFTDDRTVYIPKMVAVKPRKPVNKSDWYSWVNTSESSAACIDFIGRHDSLLTAVEKKYGVEKATIAALLRCETKHGTVTGDYHVLSVYASLALMPEEWAIAENVEYAARVMKEEGKSQREISNEIAYIKNRSVKRGKWAYNQLKHVLRIHASGTLDVRDLYGSWAGAFGWAQFIPSSYRSLAIDGNGDGTINLYHAPDVIHSVAYYLSQGGYRAGSSARIKKALKSYNPSNEYANSIYALSRRVIADMGN